MKNSTAKKELLSIDTEVLDFEVLESNNWKKFRPTVVCVETGDFNLMITGKRSSKKVRIDSLMRNNRYKEYYDNGLNTIYLNNK